MVQRHFQNKVLGSTKIHSATIQMILLYDDSDQSTYFEKHYSPFKKYINEKPLVDESRLRRELVKKLKDLRLYQISF